MTAIPLRDIRGCPGETRIAATLCALKAVTIRARDTLREWRRRSRERGQLAALDDRMLKDIGLGRAEAQFLSRKPFWRE